MSAEQVTQHAEVQTAQTFSVPNTVATTPSEQSNVPSLQDIVPEEYRNKGYMSKIKDIPTLFKSFDSAQELIGKRPAGVPHVDAPQEEWNQFYKTLGRPDTPDGYEVKLPELPEGLKSSDEQLKSFKEKAYELGLTPKQAQALIEFDVERQKGVLASINESQNVSQKQLDDEFDKLSAKVFGDRADSAIKNTKKLLGQYVPQEFADKIKDLDNNSLIALTSVLDGITRDFISEDHTFRGDNRVPTSKEDLLKEAHNLMTSEAYRTPFHVDHDSTYKRVQDIYQQVYGKK